MKHILLITFFFCAVVANGAEKKKVAVCQAEGTAIPQEMKQAFVDVIQEGIINSKQYRVVESEQVANVIKEINRQKSGIVKNDEIAKFGEAMGADFSAWASITEVFGNYQIACKLVNVESHEAIFAKSYRTKNGGDDFMELLDRIANEMFAGNNFRVEVQGIECPKCVQDDDGFVNGFITDKDETASTWNDAVNFCEKKGEGWYLPNKEELQKIYSKRNMIEGGKPFQRKDYWCSSDRGSYDAYSVNFNNGALDYYSKNESNIFRCVKHE